MIPNFAMLILDGYGVDMPLEAAIIEDLMAGLPPGLMTQVQAAAEALGEEPGLLLRPNLSSAPPVIEKQLAGHAHEAYHLSRLLWDKRERFIEALGASLFHSQITGRLREAASRHHYAPWAAVQTFLFQERSTNPTFLTRTSGEDAGFEKLDIEIQGNSDTGHQQMFNLCVAEQMSRQIAGALAEGRVEELLEPLIREMVGPEPARDVIFLKTLLSGEYGDDGYVHSCLAHLFDVIERVFNLFERYELPRSKLQLLLALDGRDSPPDSSIEGKELDGLKRYDFLGKLERFLIEREAAACITRVIGRQYMDRNYRGDLIRREIELLTGDSREDAITLPAFRDWIDSFAPGRSSASDLPAVVVRDLEGAREAIGLCHAKGLKDSEVPPIFIGVGFDSTAHDPKATVPPDLDGRGILFNLIFRADRQEPSIAALLGMSGFVATQADQKGTTDTWGWFLDGDLSLKGLAVLSMIDYHSAFTKAGVAFLRPMRPHDHNLLALANDLLPDFRVLLVGEGVKEKHVGLFARGRRPAALENEERIIFPSYGRSEGIMSDDELWRVPPMRHVEIATALLARVEADPFPLVAANFPGPDMLGHLIERNFDACVSTLNSLEAVMVGLIRGLHRLGYVVILTSDHGNVENFGPDHGTNPVLTTFVAPSSLAPLEPVKGQTGPAKLYDIPHTLLHLWGERETLCEGLDFPFGESESGEKGFRPVGHPLLNWESK